MLCKPKKKHMQVYYYARLYKTKTVELRKSKSTKQRVTDFTALEKNGIIPVMTQSTATSF
jgi:hypothetical protein